MSASGLATPPLPSTAWGLSGKHASNMARGKLPVAPMSSASRRASSALYSGPVKYRLASWTHSKTAASSAGATKSPENLACSSCNTSRAASLMRASTDVAQRQRKPSAGLAPLRPSSRSSSLVGSPERRHESDEPSEVSAKPSPRHAATTTSRLAPPAAHRLAVPFEPFTPGA
eukprot:scaffold3307_cov265-Pinguiococcus_pyrenoidosus.AAC.14